MVLADRPNVGRVGVLHADNMITGIDVMDFTDSIAEGLFYDKGGDHTVDGTDACQARDGSGGQHRGPEHPHDGDKRYESGTVPAHDTNHDT